MNSLIVSPVARVVLPCSVNERLRSKDLTRASALECLELGFARHLTADFFLAIAAVIRLRSSGESRHRSSFLITLYQNLGRSRRSACTLAR